MKNHYEFIFPNSVNGLTKREFFAAMALAGNLASQNENYGYQFSNSKGSYLEIAINDAIEHADALIEALSRPSPKR